MNGVPNEQVALIAAQEWARVQAPHRYDPAQFGAEVLDVYLAASGANAPADDLALRWRGGNQGDAGFAQGAEGGSGADEQNRLLAIIEARLTDEMRQLALALKQCSRRTQAIREEIPDGAYFCQFITRFLALATLHLSNALLGQSEGFTFEDDGALYLKKLGLQLNDFVREVNLDGRKFLAVALVDECGKRVFDANDKDGQL